MSEVMCYNDHKETEDNLFCVFAVLLYSPWRIVDDCGGAFAMGAIGGSVFHSIKGFRHAPSVRYIDCILALSYFISWHYDSNRKV